MGSSRSLRVLGATPVWRRTCRFTAPKPGPAAREHQGNCHTFAHALARARINRAPL